MRSSTLIAVPLLTAAAGVSAQAVNASYAAGLLQALNGAGFTSLASFGAILANSTDGPAFLSTLASGKNTLLAPSNAALAAAQNNSGLATPSILSTLLSYHLVSGQFGAGSFATYPNHTVTRSYLTNSTYVNLPNNQAQAVIFSRVNGTDMVLGGETSNITVSTATQYQDLTIRQIDHLLTLPASFNQTLTQNDLSTFSNALARFLLLSPITTARGATIFAPTNYAWQLQSEVVTKLSEDAITAILKNHIVNGTVGYSTLLGSGNYISAAGSQFGFFTNQTGSFVTSGTASAKIINSDVLYNGGVIHIIDNVLFNQQNNPGAAQSAYSSATAAAATAAKPTGAVVATGTSSSSGSNSGSGSSGSNTNAGVARFSLELSTLVAGALAGAALLI